MPPVRVVTSGTLKGCQNHPPIRTPLRPFQGRGIVGTPSGGVVAALLDPRLMAGSPPGCCNFDQLWISAFSAGAYVTPDYLVPSNHAPHR